MAKVKKAKATPVAKLAKKTDEFVITIKIESSVYQGAGATALEALQSVMAPQNDLISAGSVTITHGAKSKEMFFPTMQLRRLLNPYNQEVLIHDLSSGL